MTIEEISSANPEQFFLEIQSQKQCLKYKINEINDNGGFGIVYIGYRCKDNLPVAIKIINKNRIPKWFQVSEMRLFVVKMIDNFQFKRLKMVILYRLKLN